MATQLLSAVTATGSSVAVSKPLTHGYRTTSLWQVAISGAATVVIEGRLSESAAYATITTLTASGVVETVTLPDMRVTVSAYTSGTVSAWTA